MQSQFRDDFVQIFGPPIVEIGHVRQSRPTVGVKSGKVTGLYTLHLKKWGRGGNFATTTNTTTLFFVNSPCILIEPVGLYLWS